MAEVDAKGIEELFANRISEINTIISSDRNFEAGIAQISELREFAQCCERLFNSINSTRNGFYGSWIRGIPLPAMLAAKRRMTVDITPETMIDFGASYNVSPDAFINFAEAGLLAINIRNYDPDNSNAQKTLDSYARVNRNGFIQRLFERASNHIYILSTLRKPLFDPLFRGQGSLEASFTEAGKLKPAAEAAAVLDPYSESIRRAIFRNERPDLVAVRWHWAYVSATKRFSQSIDPAIYERVNSEFIRVTKDLSNSAAEFYLILASHLRYAHLLTSAPISAAFGGVYNLLLDGEAEFLQAVRFGGRIAEYDFVQDKLLDCIRSLQLGKIPLDIEQNIPVRYRQILSTFGVQVFVRFNDTSYLSHYENESNRKQLIEYVLEDDGIEASFKQMEAEVDQLLDEPTPAVSQIAQMASEYTGLSFARGQRLKKLTKLHQGIEAPTANLIALPSAPVYETDPKLVNLLIRCARVGDNNSSIGGSKDVRRRTIWFPKIFRRPPH